MGHDSRSPLQEVREAIALTFLFLLVGRAFSDNLCLACGGEGGGR